MADNSMIEVSSVRAPRRRTIAAPPPYQLAQDPATLTAPVAQGETTRSQVHHPAGQGLFNFGFNVGVPSIPKAPGGTFNTYRQMEANPTVAMAMIAGFAPIRAANISFAVDEDNGNEEMLAVIEKTIRPLWTLLLRNCLLGVSRGFQAFEKVYDVRSFNGVGGGKTYQTVRKLKPLLHEKTEVMIDDHGGFVGAKNFDQKLPVEKVFWYANEQECADYYGRARQENIRETSWWPWVQTAEKMQRYLTLASGPIPMIEHPSGEERDADDQTVPSWKIAGAIARDLCAGKAVTMPNTMADWAAEFAKTGVHPRDLRAWVISFLEPKHTYGGDYIDSLRHYERLMARGWYTPERVFQEGQNGTKAESETHTDMVFVIAEQVLADIVRHVNWYLVNPILTLNWGLKAENAVTVTVEPLVDTQKVFLRQLIAKFFESPNNADLFLTMLDLDEMLEQQDIPQRMQQDEVIQARDDAMEAELAREEEAARQAARAQAAAGGPDDGDDAEPDMPPVPRGATGTPSTPGKSPARNNGRGKASPSRK